jgi:aminoglycoside phosphotransferase (APT) family kinase protein
MGAPEAVRLLSRTTGEAYHLVGRLAGGESGAHEICGPEGERLVVKWETDAVSQEARREAVALTERLRQVAGWPVPRQRVVPAGSCLFVLQELLPGAPVETFTRDLADALLELHERRIGLEPPGDGSTWPEQLIRTLTVGGDGYCVHESLRSHDARTASLLQRIVSIGQSTETRDLGGGDVVHWDLHLGNVLQRDGQLSAIVDNDFVKVGDAAFDLVTLWISSLTVRCEPGVRDRLFERAVEPLGEARRRAYLAHLLLRCIDWPIRRGRPAEVEFWLGQANRLLPR